MNADDAGTIQRSAAVWQAARARYLPERVAEQQVDTFEYRVGVRPVLVTAVHATPSRRDGEPKPSESDTGPLAEALHEAFGYSSLTMTGPQSGDANWDVVHPARTHVAAILPTHRIVLDLHLMRDAHGPDLCLGLGPAPDATSGQFAAVAAFEAVTLGITCSVNWPFSASPRTLTALVQSLGGTALQVETAVRMVSLDAGNNSSVRLLKWWTRIDDRLRAHLA